MRASSGGGSACSGSWRGICRWRWRTTARIPTAWRSGVRSDYLPQQYWIPGSLNARDNAAQALLTANVTNPFLLSNFAALRTTNPVLYQRMSANGFFTATTVQRNRLLRPFAHLNNLSFSNLPLGEVKVHSLQMNVNRRFADGFTANAAVSFSSSRAEPHRRGVRPRAHAVVERQQQPAVPGVGRRGLRAAVRQRQADAERRRRVGGTGRRLAGGRHVRVSARLADQLQRTNLFYYGNLDDIKKSKPEIALNPNGTIDRDEVLVQRRRTSRRDPTKTPTSFQTRAFPFQIDGLRGPGLTYVNMNVVRNFQLGGRRVLQARMDVQNLLNYAAYNNPVTDPTNSNFGRVTTAVGSAGAMRFFNFVARFTF